MGCNNGKPVNKDALVQVKRNICTRNLERDIKYKRNTILENEKQIELISNQIGDKKQSSLDHKMHRRLLSTKKLLEEEIFEQEMRIDILSQHTKTSLSSEYLNDSVSVKS